MQEKTRFRLIAGAAAAVAVAGGGAAVAATQLRSSSRADNQAIVDDAAHQLGIEPSALGAALQKALENRVDAAVAAGRLTQAQAAELKQQIESGNVPLFARPGFGFRDDGRPDDHFGGLASAASYLGLGERALRAELDAGKTLAQVAADRGKSVSGLIDAMVAAAKTRLDPAVKAGRLTQGQEDRILADVRQRTTDLVDGTFPARPRGFGFRHDDGLRGGPRPSAAPTF